MFISIECCDNELSHDLGTAIAEFLRQDLFQGRNKLLTLCRKQRASDSPSALLEFEPQPCFARGL